jgi:VWFA-related protein
MTVTSSGIARTSRPAHLSRNAGEIVVDRSRIVCRVMGGLLIFGFWPFHLAAQQIPSQELQFVTQSYTPPATLRVQRNVVQMDVVVRDAKGQAIAGLTEKDFNVYDKGKEQVLNEFTVVNEPALAANSAGGKPNATISPSPATSAAPPRYIALFFDDRSTPFNDLRYAQDAAEKFVRENFHRGDKVGIFTASGSPTLDFTGDTQKLIRGIESVHVQTLGPSVTGCPGTPREYPMGPYAAYRIVVEGDTEVRNLYSCGDGPSGEAETEVLARTVLSSTEFNVESTLARLDNVISHLAGLSGGRVVVLTSSGFFTSSLQPQIDEIAANALEAGVVINSLDAKGLVALSPGADAKDSPLNSFSGLPFTISRSSS